MPARDEFDAIVIGAGIGGACAALGLARRGARVALLDSGTFPRHKVCGEFLSPEIRPVLERLGALDAVRAAGPLEVDRARIIDASGRALEFPIAPCGWALSRYRLDTLLWKLAGERGVCCLDRSAVSDIARTEAGFTITAADRTLQARQVIAAHGRKPMRCKSATAERTGSPRFTGLKTHFRNANVEPGTVELHLWGGGYCGVVQVEDGLTNVCLLATYRFLRESKGSPAALWQRLLGLCPALRAQFAKAEQTLPWLATANVAFEAIRPTKDGVLRCGDAAGYIQPMTGDGMAMAARGGELAAAVAAARLDGGLGEESTELYEVACRREFGGRLRWGNRLHPIVLDPRLAMAAARSVAVVPGLAKLLVERTRGEVG